MKILDNIIKILWNVAIMLYIASIGIICFWVYEGTEAYILIWAIAFVAYLIYRYIRQAFQR